MYYKKCSWEFAKLEENTCAMVSFLIKLQTFCGVSKNIFFTEHLGVTASRDKVFSNVSDVFIVNFEKNSFSGQDFI